VVYQPLDEMHRDKMHHDAPYQFPFKPQFMGGYLIKSINNLKITLLTWSHASLTKGKTIS